MRGKDNARDNATDESGRDPDTEHHPYANQACVPPTSKVERCEQRASSAIVREDHHRSSPPRLEQPRQSTPNQPCSIHGHQGCHDFDGRPEKQRHRHQPWQVSEPEAKGQSEDDREHARPFWEICGATATCTRTLWVHLRLQRAGGPEDPSTCSEDSGAPETTARIALTKASTVYGLTIQGIPRAMAAATRSLRE